MKIVRGMTAQGRTVWAVEDEAGGYRRLGTGPAGRVPTAGARPGARVALARLLAPADPPAIFCIGLNYRAHAAESGAPIPAWPVLFMKNPAALQHPGAPIRLPRRLASHKVDYEAELAIVLARDCLNVSRQDARGAILGYTCANDVSARDWQREHGGGQWCRAKTFDTFCPLGPRLVTPDEFPEPPALRVRSILNGATMQDGHTADMIFDVYTLIEFLSGSTTLPAGSVILTGTPPGVGMARQPPVWLRPGDTIRVELEGIGALENPVIEEPV